MENAGRGGICGLACDVCKGVGMANTLGSRSLIFGLCGVTASDGSASGLGEEPLSVAKGRSNVVIQLVRTEKAELTLLGLVRQHSHPNSCCICVRTAFIAGCAVLFL